MMIRSSTEVEYRSMAHIVVELYWLRMLLKELHLSLLTTPYIWVDNISALTLSSNPIFHAKTKYIEINSYFIREKIFIIDIQNKYISILAKFSNIFTKKLSSSRSLSLRDKLMVYYLPSSLKEAIIDKLSVSYISNT